MARTNARLAAAVEAYVTELNTDGTTYLCEIMDAAYDSIEVDFNADLSGHAVLTNVNTRRDTQLKEDRAREAWA